ncbi:NAD dependent epimerase [Fusarium pseudocircinatum]|uniref:NAD dependent epimerase n=1 Tax=Fusarium pseudocircinatum TaxID=56676 RepID=A0A8H5PQ74_9HYPO|nr:NAD dependent epimerase [Fusarium pseudocircinatum]
MTTEKTDGCEAVEESDTNDAIVGSFNSDDSQQHRNVPKDVLIAYNPDIGIQHIRYFAGPYQLEKDESSVVIQIDGVCRAKETRYAQGGWGIFFGPKSQYNKWGLLPADAPQNSTFAELYALMIAVEIIRDELPLHPGRIFIMSDSLFLAQAFTEYMSVWRQNGKITAPHWNSVLHNSMIIDDLAWSSDRKMEVKFWHVPRKLNMEANALANRAFN